MTPLDYIQAARVPLWITPKEFGLWTLARINLSKECRYEGRPTLARAEVGFDSYTLLGHMTESSMHMPIGEIVMEDSVRELRKHLPIWIAAHGRVLVTGLGLGCVVRGLLAKPEVDQIDVVELDDDILRVIGPEFAKNPRVNLHHGDALKIELSGRFDFAWHDLWVDGTGLQSLHANLLVRFHKQCRRQGAWAFPRQFARLFNSKTKLKLLGAPRYD